MRQSKAKFLLDNSFCGKVRKRADLLRKVRGKPAESSRILLNLCGKSAESSRKARGKSAQDLQFPRRNCGKSAETCGEMNIVLMGV